MKKGIFICILFIISNTVMTQNKFELHVYLNAKYKNSKVFLVSYFPYTSYESTVMKDSLHYKFNGEFSKLYENCVLGVQNGVKGNFINIFIQKGKSEVHIEKLTAGNLKNEVKFINFPMLNQQIDYWRLTSKLFYEIDSCNKLIYNPSVKDSILVNQLTERKKILNERIYINQKLFIKRYPASYFSLHFFEEYVLKKIFVNADTVTSIFSGLDPQIKGTEYGKILEQKVANMQSVQINSFFSNATFISTDMVKHNIIDFRKRNYLLVCFWGSWCAPCVKGIPILKEIYNEYNKKGLEMVSIAIDDKMDNWQSSLSKYKMPWFQTICNEEYMPNENAKLKYNLTFFPQYFLVNMEGKIIYHNVLMHDDDNYSILKGILFRTIK